MKTNRTLAGWLMLAALSTFSLQPSALLAQGTTAFTYQGQLHDSGTNANGAYTMIFKLCDAASGGNQIGSAITTSATLANGLFTVNLDFGAGAFNGSARWLDITVQTGSDSEELSPRVQLLPAPYAQFAAVAASVTNGAITAPAIANGAVGSSQLAPNLTVSGTLNVANSLEIGGTNWNVNVQTVAGPPGTGLTITNALVFSANGLPYLDFMDVAGHGPVVYSPDQLVTMGLLCEGSFEVKDTNFNTLVGIDTDGISVNDANGKQMAQIDSGGNINANGNITANGGFEVVDTNGNHVANIDSKGNIGASGIISASGGLGVVGNNGWAANIDSDGNISANGNITANNLNVTSRALALGSYPDWTVIYGDGNGGLAVTAPNVGGVSIDPGGISIYGNSIGLNVNGCTTIDDSGNIHANWFNGLGVHATVGCTAPYFNTTSDRNLKENFMPTDNQEILERVASLPISRWNFKADGQTRHIGPMAQDFYAAFNVGTDDKHIATVDEDGVALAAIQGLNEKLKAKDAQIEALEKRLADLEQLVKTAVQK
jgi:hypothetical protein